MAKPKYFVDVQTDMRRGQQVTWCVTEVRHAVHTSGKAGLSLEGQHLINYFLHSDFSFVKNGFQKNKIGKLNLT